MIKDNNLQYNSLRKEYNVFSFERFDYVSSSDKIIIKYTFNLADKHTFKPELIVHLDQQRHALPDKNFLDNLVFQMGMIELISYWKAACSPVVVVKPFNLDEAQVRFWKKLYFNGLGEFFYVNGIQADEESFVEIVSASSVTASKGVIEPDPNRVLVPVGGGKDSVVTLELLKKEYHLVPYIINPRAASLGTAAMAGFDPSNVFRVDRSIDPLLIDLNEQGFLNGHTPFSAVVAFSSLLAATLADCRYIALSNESSANEPTVADGPNHQYSKSYAFEKDFREYAREYITSGVHYFSFLRPLGELAIARLFSRNSAHFPVFKSCNVGSKEDRWCGKCPKCLFTAVILSPFLARNQIIDIFGYDILENENLVPLLDSLRGAADAKPFECVGTMDEVNQALVIATEKLKPDLPALLRHFISTAGYESYRRSTRELTVDIDTDHFLEVRFLNILKGAIDEV